MSKSLHRDRIIELETNRGFCVFPCLPARITNKNYTETIISRFWFKYSTFILKISYLFEPPLKTNRQHCSDQNIFLESNTKISKQFSRIYFVCIYILFKKIFQFFFTYSFAKHFGPKWLLLKYYIRVFLYIIILQITLLKKKEEHFPHPFLYWFVTIWTIWNLNYCYFYIKLWTPPWVPSIGPKVTGCTN